MPFNAASQEREWQEEPGEVRGSIYAESGLFQQRDKPRFAVAALNVLQAVVRAFQPGECGDGNHQMSAGLECAVGFLQRTLFVLDSAVRERLKHKNDVVGMI